MYRFFTNTNIIKSSFGDRFIYQKTDNKITPERTEIQRAIFNAKKHIIENQLYGIDINPNSVNICRLRLWIELLKHTYYVDDKYLDLEVLPNLEFKVMTADSLIALKRESESLVASDYEPLKHELQSKFSEYFTAVNDNKFQIKNEITEILEKMKTMTTFSSDGQDQIEQLKAFSPFNTTVKAPFFDSGLMFGIDGVDVVLMNPPFFTIDSNNPNKATYESMYKDVKSGRINIYQLFLKLGYALLVKGGYMCAVHPKTLLSDKYLTATRKFLQNNMKHELLINIQARKGIFEKVTQAVMISMFQNTTPTQNDICLTSEIHTQNDFINMKYVYKNINDIITQNEVVNYIVSSDEHVYGIFNKMNNISQKMSINFTTGKIEWNKYKSYLFSTKTNNSIQIIYGENIQRYQFQQASVKRASVIYINDIKEDLPILTNKAIIVQRTTSIEQKYRIISTIVDPKKFPNPIITENHTSFIIAEDRVLYYLQGIISSKLLNFYFNLINSNTQVSSGELNTLPIPTPTPEIELQITSLVQTILSKKEQSIDTTPEELQINKLVYEMYGLTDDEIELIEKAK